MKDIKIFIVVSVILVGFAVQKYWLDKVFGVDTGMNYHWNPFITLGIISEYIIILLIANKHLK